MSNVTTPLPPPPETLGKPKVKKTTQTYPVKKLIDKIRIEEK
jgi:hypothetical protein